MSNGPMHSGEFDVNQTVVRALVAEQFPEWSHLELARVPSRGTVNAIWRLGSDLVLRLPRTEQWAMSLGRLEDLHEWLLEVRASVPLAVPEPLAIGAPSSSYPWCWAVHHWIDGAPISDLTIADTTETAELLAAFVNALHALPQPAPDAPRSVKAISRKAWSELFPGVVKGLHGIVDVDAAMAAWERTLAVPGWAGGSVWTHADLLPDNLLADGGRLSAVIDFECYGAGEPALDLTPAWFIFSKRQRAVFRQLVDVDTATWERARNHALRAVMGIRYYETTNPDFAAMCLRTVNEAMIGD